MKSLWSEWFVLFGICFKHYNPRVVAHHSIIILGIILTRYSYRSSFQKRNRDGPKKWILRHIWVPILRKLCNKLSIICLISRDLCLGRKLYTPLLKDAHTTTRQIFLLWFLRMKVWETTWLSSEKPGPSRLSFW